MSSKAKQQPKKETEVPVVETPKPKPKPKSKPSVSVSKETETVSKETAKPEPAPKKEPKSAPVSKETAPKKEPKVKAPAKEGTIGWLKEECRKKNIEFTSSNSKTELMQKLGMEIPKKKVKRERDPNAPVRPLSVYMRYNAVEREKIIAETPDLKTKVKDVAKLLGQRWKGLSDEQKRPYQESYDKEKKVYDIAYEKYMTEKNKHLPPKKPKTTFLLFSNDPKVQAKCNKDYPDLSFVELNRKKGELWKAMTEEQKKPYVAEYEKSKVVYEQALSEFQKREGIEPKAPKTKSTRSHKTTESSDVKSKPTPKSEPKSKPKTAPKTESKVKASEPKAKPKAKAAPKKKAQQEEEIEI